MFKKIILLGLYLFSCVMAQGMQEQSSLRNRFPTKEVHIEIKEEEKPFSLSQEAKRTVICLGVCATPFVYVGCRYVLNAVSEAMIMALGGKA